MISSSLAFPGELWSVNFLARPFLPTPGTYKTFLIFSIAALPTGHGEGGLANGGCDCWYTCEKCGEEGVVWY